MKVAGVAGIYKSSCQDVYRNKVVREISAAEKCGSEYERKSADNEVPKVTAYKTKLSCKVLESWKMN